MDLALPELSQPRDEGACHHTQEKPDDFDDKRRAHQLSLNRGRLLLSPFWLLSLPCPDRGHLLLSPFDGNKIVKGKRERVHCIRFNLL